MLEVAGQASQTHYHSISGEILPHFYVKNTFLAQKLKKLEHFKEIPEMSLKNLSKYKKLSLYLKLGRDLEIVFKFPELSFLFKQPYPICEVCF